MLTRRQALLLAAAAPLPRGPVRRISAWTASTSLAGLKAAAEDKPARVIRTKSPSDDLIVLIVLDVTGDLTLVDPARQAAAAEIDKLPPNAYAGLLRSQDGLRVLLDPSPDRPAAVAALQNAPISGRAGLLESVEPAARLATSVLRKSSVRTALLYLTDSAIENYREDYTNPVINMSDARDLSRRFPDALIREKAANLAASLAETDAPLFIVQLAFFRDRLNEAYQSGLQQIAEATGGQALLCRNLGDIPTSVEQAFQKIRAMWAIDLELPPGSPRNLTIQLTAEATDLQYRSRLTLGGPSKGHKAEVRQKE
jgi:hypothetical protein